MFDPEETSALTKDNVFGAVKGCFMEILRQLKETGGEESVKEYFEWLQDSVKNYNDDSQDMDKTDKVANSELLEICEANTEMYEKHKETINLIRRDLKLMLLETSNSDTINIPSSSTLTQCEKVVTVTTEEEEEEQQQQHESKKKKKREIKEETKIYVNQFLYEDINEALRDQNLESIFKCCDCESTSVTPRQIITHSASVESLIQLFTFYVPNYLTNLKLLDIGSGVGSILYGAYYFSKAKEICGIEINEQFVTILNHLVQKYNMDDRVKVIHGDILDHRDLLNAADVVTFNNVLEYFASIEVQKQIWLFIRKSLKSGCLFITLPDIHTLLKPLDLEEIISDWLVPLEETNIDRELISAFPDTDEKFYTYKVK